MTQPDPLKMIERAEAAGLELRELLTQGHQMLKDLRQLRKELDEREESLRAKVIHVIDHHLGEVVEARSEAVIGEHFEALMAQLGKRIDRDIKKVMDAFDDTVKNRVNILFDELHKNPTGREVEITRMELRTP